MLYTNPGQKHFNWLLRFSMPTTATTTVHTMYTQSFIKDILICGYDIFPVAQLINYYIFALQFQMFVFQYIQNEKWKKEENENTEIKRNTPTRIKLCHFNDCWNLFPMGLRFVCSPHTLHISFGVTPFNFWCYCYSNDFTDSLCVHTINLKAY